MKFELLFNADVLSDITLQVLNHLLIDAGTGCHRLLTAASIVGHAAGFVLFWGCARRLHLNDAQAAFTHCLRVESLLEDHLNGGFDKSDQGQGFHVPDRPVLVLDRF